MDAQTPDLEALTTAIEDFTTIFIRLPSVRRFNFSTLSVLHTLARRGPLRLTDLTATEQLKQPALTSLVAKLERDGLVSRAPDARDGRAMLLSLTPEGRAIVDSRRTSRVERLTELVNQLSPEDRALLAGSAGVLQRLTEIASADRSDRRDGLDRSDRRDHAD
ncbi:MarR family transcriptional regulator [Kribbella sp. NPDC051770]|uniref:MarR family winged helix-turn-helix transcriptional regulator n=1 Tax=Kribbella sp. NPDC051770 TaxID=3155413 RepID=UPI00343795DE